MDNEYTIKSIDGKLSIEAYKELVKDFIKASNLNVEDFIVEEKGAKK